MKLLAFGDTRSQPSVMEQVISQMRREYAADPEFQSITLQAGDWVRSDAEAYWTTEWFNANPQTRALLAETPVNGVKGNHENVAGFSQYYPKYYPYPYVNLTPNPLNPQQFNNLYWSFDYGPIHFTVVDQYSPYEPGSAQYDWVVNDLATTTKPWKILMYHHPAWGAGKHENNVTTQQVFDPLIAQYRVDLVLAGHNHNYARCQSDVPNETSIAPGVPYFTNGGGGAPLYPVDTTNAGAFKNVVAAYSGYEYMTFEVRGPTLVATAKKIDLDANNNAVGTSVIETVTIHHDAPSPIGNRR